VQENPPGDGTTSLQNSAAIDRSDPTFATTPDCSRQNLNVNSNVQRQTRLPRANRKHEAPIPNWNYSDLEHYSHILSSGARARHLLEQSQLFTRVALSVTAIIK
jgi:hypothetical protein